jgi:hypothetical protein
MKADILDSQGHISKETFVEDFQKLVEWDAIDVSDQAARFALMVGTYVRLEWLPEAALDWKIPAN